MHKVKLHIVATLDYNTQQTSMILQLFIWNVNKSKACKWMLEGDKMSFS